MLAQPGVFVYLLFSHQPALPEPLHPKAVGLIKNPEWFLSQDKKELAFQTRLEAPN